MSEPNVVELFHGDLYSIAYRAELDKFLPIIGRARITPAELTLAGLLELGYDVEVTTLEGKSLPGRRRIELADEVKEVVTGRYVENLLDSDRVHHLRLSARCLGAKVKIHYSSDWGMEVGGYGVNPSKLHKNRALVKLLEFVSTREPSFTDLVVDLGAAPGGWSSFAAQVAENVVAVDPARLEDRVRELENVHHLRITAHEFVLPEMIGVGFPGEKVTLLSDIYSGNPEDDLYAVLRLLERLENDVAWGFVKVAPAGDDVLEWFMEEIEEAGFAVEKVNIESASSNETFVYFRE
ncbi:SAM-dependent methyltransferase [Methanopyrus sp.]